MICPIWTDEKGNEFILQGDYAATEDEALKNAIKGKELAKEIFGFTFTGRFHRLDDHLKYAIVQRFGIEMAVIKGELLRTIERASKAKNN
jgi:hypothetical protein